jgi:hypothetical protein
MISMDDKNASYHQNQHTHRQTHTHTQSSKAHYYHHSITTMKAIQFIRDAVIPLVNDVRGEIVSTKIDEISDTRIDLQKQAHSFIHFRNV